MSLLHLDPATRPLIALAGAIATGREPLVESGCRDCVRARVPAGWVDELLLQSVLMVGWPRALIAAALWRRVGAPEAAAAEDGTEYSRAEEWRLSGEAICREIYAKNYARLRENVRALHPALDAWMVVEGYGRTLGRPGLDLARRELCVVGQVAVQGAERQLHAHLKGAINAGAAPAVVAETLEIVRPLLGPGEWEIAMSLWTRVRQ